MLRRKIAALAVAAALGGGCATLATAVPASAATSHAWMENAFTTHDLYQSFPTNASYFYDRAGSFGTGDSPTTNPIMDGFATTPVLRYESLAQFQSDIANGVIPNSTFPAGSWVEYDNEQWAGTPTSEQQNPQQSMLDFGTAAHNAGFKVIMTPARDLGNVATDCPKQSGEDNNGWYNRCDISGYAVQNGDDVVVQDQANTLTPTLYQSFFNTAQANAVAANSAAQVLSEVSDGYGTAAQAWTAFNKLNRTKCAGSFIHVANSNVSWENTFLNSVKSGGW